MYIANSLYSHFNPGHTFTVGHKRVWLADLTVIALGVTAGIAILLAAYHIPVGHLNSLRETGFAMGAVLIFLSLSVSVIDLYLLQKEKRNTQSSQITQNPDDPLKPERDLPITGIKETPAEGDPPVFHISTPNHDAIAVPSRSEEILKEKLMESDSNQRGVYKKRDNTRSAFDEDWVRRGLEHIFPNDPQNPLRLEIEALFGSSGFTYIRHNKTNPIIYTPGNAALCQLAFKYAKKYEIVIKVEYYGEFQKTLENLNNQINIPLYVGIILYQNDGSLGDALINFHVTPILVYFPGTQIKEEIQYVILDSVGKYEEAHYAIKKFCVDTKKIYYSTMKRQADGYSCRFGAIKIVLNSLLSLEYHGRKEGFSEALLEVDKEVTEAGIKVSSFPSEWVYTEQILHDCPIKDEDIAVKSLYSKKQGKEALTVKEHRRKHTQKTEFVHTIVGMAVEPLISPIPLGIQYKENRRCHRWKLTLLEEKEVNTYLVNKGNRSAEKHKVSAQPF